MKTYIVCGVPRGGTSMIAGLLRIFGINMGDKIDETKHEDLEFEKAKNVEDIREIIKKRNNEGKFWGFKNPWIGLFIKEVQNEFVNPQYIFITRDLVSCMNSDLKHNSSFENRDEPKEYIWYRNLNMMNNINKVVKVSDKSSLFLSYDESLKRPEDLINNMEKFLQIKLNPEKRRKAINFVSPGYKEIK